RPLPDRARPAHRRAGDAAHRAARGRGRGRGLRRARGQGRAHSGDPGLHGRAVGRGDQGPEGRRARGHRGQGRAARRQSGPGRRRSRDGGRRSPGGREQRIARGGDPGRQFRTLSRRGTPVPNHSTPHDRVPGNRAPVPAPHRSMSLVEFATRRRVTVAMATVTFLLFGLIALSSLKVNLLPDLSYPTLTVRTEYTGAAPAEIETLITEPVEEAVGVVKGLRKLKSVSRTGQSDVVLEFAWGTDMDKASLEVRDKMEALNLPMEAKAPVLLRFNPSTAPIMRLVLSAKGAPAGEESLAELTRLRRYADDDLKRKLEPVEGVAAVKVGGGLEDEIQVAIDQQKLAQLGVSIE